jgi:1-deoxyxylulose-5-phosphate synthase
MTGMSYARVGSSGLVVSRLVLGMMSFGDTSRRPWHLDSGAARPLVRRAVEGGVTAFDTADVYDRGASEEVTGGLLRELFPRREDYVLATKVYYPMSDRPGDGGLSRRHILASIDASLRRLGTDHVDVYYVHRWDYDTPIEETMEVLDAVVRAGKARYLGASSMYAWQLAKANHVAETHGWHRFVAMQNHYHLAYREEEREMVPSCLDQGIGVLPYSPLARGLLAGTRRRGGGGTTTRSRNDPAASALSSDDDFDVVDALVDVASELGRPAAQVALAWLRDRPGVVAPIVGVTKQQHLDDALASLDLELGEDEVARLEAPYRPHAVVGPE